MAKADDHGEARESPRSTTDMDGHMLCMLMRIGRIRNKTVRLIAAIGASEAQRRAAQ
jgi:hypothetical protein